MAESPRKKVILGLILVIIGTLFLLENLGFAVELPSYLFKWPAIFLLLGFINLLAGKIRQGIILLLLCGVFYLHYFQLINLQVYWPIILILLGIAFIFRKSTIQTNTTTQETFFDQFTILGSVDKKYTNQTLIGGKANVLFGNCKIDLREAQIEENAQIELFVLLGGIELIVPSDWEVENKSSVILGGLADKRNTSSTTKKKISVSGMILLGGGEIRN